MHFASDNVITKYLLSADQTTAQNTIANKNRLVGSTLLENGSDNLLLTVLDDIMGCKPFTARDLAETNVVSLIPSLALNELAAARQQGPPVALVPDSDPMATVDGAPNKAKLALYRSGVNQPVGVSASDLDYCTNYANVAPPRFLANKDILLKAPSLDPATSDSMFTFLAARFATSFSADGLNCTGFGLSAPIVLTTNADGVVVDAVITVNANNNNELNIALIGGAVGGGVGGILIFASAIFAIRRRSRRSLDRETRMESPNPGYQNGGQGGGFGGGFGGGRIAASFQGFRQSFMPSQWGQNIRQSMMMFGGGGRAAPTGAVPMSSQMSSAPNPQFSPNQFGAPSRQYGGPSTFGYGGPPGQFGGAPPGQFGRAPPGQFGGAPSPGSYGPPNTFGQNPYGGGQQSAGYSQQPPPYGGGHNRGGYQ